MEFIKKISFKQLLPLIIIACGIAVFALLKATRPDSETAVIKERSWHVQTIKAKLQQLSPTLTLYGQIETPELVNAAAPKKSRVVNISVREGDPISKGQLLLSLDERDFRPYLLQAKAKADELRALISSEHLRYQVDKKAINHEKSILHLEHSAVKRAEMLKHKNLGSTAALEQAQEALNRQYLTFSDRKLALDDHKARLQQLQARLAYAEAEVELAKLDLERSRIIAPFDGFIEKLSVATGDQVKENQPLLTFYPSDKLELRAKIPAPFQSEIQRALQANHLLKASADYAGVPLDLKLDRFSGKADSRGIDALFTIRSTHKWIRPGATLTLTLQRPSHKNVVALPFSAIYNNNRIYRINHQRLQAVTVEILGDFNQGEQNLLLVHSPELKQNEPILVTQLPEAITGLKVIIDQ